MATMAAPASPRRGAVRARAARVVALAVAMLGPASTRGDGDRRAHLRVCIADTGSERSAAMLLSRFLSTVRLETDSARGCLARPSPGYVGRFEGRAGRLAFVVRAPSG